MKDCIFCKIINGQIPSTKVYENDKVFCFNDINPKAKTHILIIPKKHIESIKVLGQADREVISEIIFTAQKIAQDKNMDGYKLLFNVGREGGQLVGHMHLHLLSKDCHLLTN